MNVLDGNWMVVRNFHASNKMQDESGFLNHCLGSILRFVKNNGYKPFAVAWDQGKYRYRADTKGVDYKGDRVYDDSFKVCWNVMDRLRQILPSIGIKCLQFPGIEADDIGYWCAYTPELSHFKEINLISSDRDWFISINERTNVIRPLTGDKIQLYSESILEEEFGLSHFDDYLLYKSIVGDGSDNIPGITQSAALIKEYISGYKLSTLDEEIKSKMEVNIHLMRLDRILTDEEVCASLKQQLNTPFVKRPLSLLLPPNYPVYFNGIIGKYMREQGLL